MTAARSRRVGRPPGRAKKYGPERGPSDAVGRRLSTRWKSAESGASAPTTSAQQPRVPGLVFPTLQAVQGLKPPAGIARTRREARGMRAVRKVTRSGSNRELGM